MIETRPVPRSGTAGEAESPEPLLLQMRVDRRLGHEWDDWDGNPLPNGGVFTTGPGLFFGAAVAVGLVSSLVLALGIWMVSPRLEAFNPALPIAVFALVAAGLIAWLLWLAVLGASFRLDRPLLPAKLAESGLLPRSMKLIESACAFCGLSRDRFGSSALLVFNRLSGTRTRANSPGDLLILLPRCLSKTSMQTALRISEKYGVAAFVASRGRYARQMIAKRRPRAVVAVACERDLVSGVGDVAHRLPVLGSTLAMPEGPCRNTELDAATFENQLRVMLGKAGKGAVAQ